FRVVVTQTHDFDMIGQHAEKIGKSAARTEEYDSRSHLSHSIFSQLKAAVGQPRLAPSTIADRQTIPEQLRPVSSRDRELCLFCMHRKRTRLATNDSRGSGKLLGYRCMGCVLCQRFLVS